jgi:uncharacterized repeat protein (TIGR03803 family)
MNPLQPHSHGRMLRPPFRTGATLLLWAVLSVTPSLAQTYTENILHSFSGSPNDGAVPTSGLIMDSTGNLYGTTYFGGGSSNYGSVYKVTTGGVETVLYSFTETDGANPVAALLRDSKGNLYGTTQSGGTLGFGTVFKVSARDAEEILYSFENGSDGSLPFASVAMDKSGNLYSTTFFGGIGGTLFKLNTSDVETQLHTFEGSPFDGMLPFSGVILDTTGNMYGTTSVGGSSSCPETGADGCGIVYKYSESGVYSVLHTFAGSDGQYPYYGSLVRDTHGNLYGTTYQGGAHGYGTVFKLTTGGVESILHSFSGGHDGAFPLGGLVEDSSGNFYGTTYQGGTSGFGTVFKLTSGGTKTVLHNFSAANGDGAYPMSTLVRDKSGNLYGTTQSGGNSGLGIVFELKP